MAIDQLQKLADRHRIAAGFTDNLGNHQLTEPDVMCAMLCALGEVPEAALTRHEVAAKGAAAGIITGSGKISGPPVLVVTQGQPLLGTLAFPLLAQEIKTAPLLCRYSIEAEQGDRFNGSIELQSIAASDAVLHGELDESDSGQCGYHCSFHLELSLPDGLKTGYHRLVLQSANAEGIDEEPFSVSLIVVPQRAVGIDPCHKPIGVSVQLYSLRSAYNWGIGDFTDLKALCSTLASHSIDTVGINPVHSLYKQHPDRCSPYSPSSRVFLNPLYIDVLAVPGVCDSNKFHKLIHSDEFSSRLASLRAAEQVDYEAVAAVKFEALELIFSSVYAELPELPELHNESNTGDRKNTTGNQQSVATRKAIQRFHRFVAERGDDLQLHARFEAFDQYFSTVKGLQNWSDWPACYHDPDTAECRELAAGLVNEIAFSCFLQWIADEQLADAAAHTEALGMRYGLYMDLAVGVDRQGGEVWARPQEFARGMHIGAPPDALGPLGQDWSLTPYNPSALKNSGYQAFIGVLRAAMRFAGILRIDHVMGLVRQYWCVPALRRDSGMAPGAYINFPVDDLLGLVALESQRNQCVVIGEDLGTVPEGFRDRLKQRGIHGYRVLYFEKDEAGNFRQPQHYEPETLATASTHDLPTLAGYLNRRDIMLRVALGHIQGQDQIGDSLAHRQLELANLMDHLALHKPVWLESSFNTQGATAPPVEESQSLPGTVEFINAVHRMLARTQSAILVLQLEDLLQQLDMANLPGTIDEHPNWKRRLPVSLEALPQYLSARQTLSDVVELRKAS